MIIIDGKQLDLKINSFSNLEEILVKVTSDSSLKDRVVTNVIVNDEEFSEIYPHQAEDIDSKDITSLEIETTSTTDMAFDIVTELHKVIGIMNEGSKQIANLFRQADDAEALGTFQDLIDVTRDFLGMIATLRVAYSLENSNDFSNQVESISTLLAEMTECLENEDWILLSDLLEYEYLPLTEQWQNTILEIEKNIK